jgi:uncharacterized flavoprotein (TIGR03862 family)
MHIAIIGGGPAGLRAAEVAAAGGAQVTLFDAKASVGRKLLVAGRGGLNLTKVEPREKFVAQYSGSEQPRGFWSELIAGFDPGATRAWAAGLGVETFAASTGRVYPRELKAAPLLRRWVQRLRDSGVRFEMHHRLVGLSAGEAVELRFQTRPGGASITADAAVLALGGGSWPETGSDGGWLPMLAQLGVEVAPLAPANCGWETIWPASVLEQAEGQPLKNITARAGTESAAGELMVTRYGLEGGALYQLAATLRAMPQPELTVDFKPDTSKERLIEKLRHVSCDSIAAVKARLRLSTAAVAVLEGFCHDAPSSAETMASAVKACRIPLTGPRPIAEAISSAGGVRWSSLAPDLMLAKLPGVFVAGEMIDWEAPTGGYLIQGCLATGQRAGVSALAWTARCSTR